MANDIIDINVYESTETVAITVNPNLTTVNINKVAGGGSGVTNLSTTQTASNFTINSDTGEDAIVPLGNGTLAGATINDYTTAEKNKLLDTYTKSEVDTKITGVYKVKGSVANYAALPSSGQVIGDVWNLLDTGGNYVWTGTTWDELGTTIDISGKANIFSPTFTGIPLAPTATAGTNTTQIATTAFTTTAIAGKMNNPSLTANYIPKALTATTIGNSRLLDTGNYLGINTVNTPLKDVALGYQTNREIGVEQSDSTTIGRDLNISAGTTVNYSLNSDFVALNQSSSNWNSICGHVNNNVYVAVNSGANGGIYTQTGGVGNFTQTSIFTSPQVFAITCLPNGNIYVTTAIDIYKQPAAAGSFVAQSSGLVTNSTSKISSDINNNIYVIINNSSGLIYKKTNDSGSFEAMSITSRLYNSITCHPNGNIYATVLNGDIYMQTAGSGDFNPLSQTTRSWNALACTSNGNVYAQAGSLIYMQTAGAGNFILQSSLTSRFYTSLGADINGNVYATVAQPVAGGDIYKQINATIGTDNLKGGTLKLNSGTGKGTGASDIEMYTGQILTSGTDMQTSTLRAKIDNTGLMTLPSVTNALIIADTTGKAVATKEYVASVAGGVPYTGATSDVNLGEFGIQLGNLEFDNTPTNIPTTAGSMYYNDTDGTLDLILKGGNVKLQIGQESVVRVVNKTATNIDLLEANYQAVRVTGAQGQRLKVDLAQATNDVLSAETIGLVTETIANNQEGFITTSGLVRNINTTGSLQSETWLDGDVLYLSPTVAGRITKVKPIAPNHLVIIGYVISAHATQGTIFVKVDNGYELDELHNVKIDSVTNNEVLAYTSATDIWENKTPSEAGIQPILVSATNIKTINGNTILGSGDLTISGTGISSLNGLTGETQTFSVTTNTGTGIPAWTSSGTNHQLNIPIAGGASTGLITGTSQSISGAKTFLSNPEIPVPAGNSGPCIVLGSTGGGGATGTLSIGDTVTYPNGVEMQRVKGVTSNIQTQLDGKVNGFDVAEQTYSGSPTWSGTAPTTILANTYKWNQVGSLVTVRLSLSYSVAGSNATVIIPLPTDLPTPASPTGFTGASDILYYGVGMFNTSTTTIATTPRTVLLRRNSANNGYEFLLTTGTAISIRVVHLTLQYFT